MDSRPKASKEHAIDQQAVDFIVSRCGQFGNEFVSDESGIPLRTTSWIKKERKLGPRIRKVAIEYLGNHARAEKTSPYFGILREADITEAKQDAIKEFCGTFTFIRATSNQSLVFGTFSIHKDNVDGSYRFQSSYRMGDGDQSREYIHKGYVFCGGDRLFILNVAWGSLTLSILDAAPRDLPLGVRGMTLSFARNGPALAYRFIISSVSESQLKTEQKQKFLRLLQMPLKEKDISSYSIDGW